MEQERTTYNHRLELRLDGELKRAIEQAAGKRGVNEWLRQAARSKLAYDKPWDAHKGKWSGHTE